MAPSLPSSKLRLISDLIQNQSFTRSQINEAAECSEQMINNTAGTCDYSEVSMAAPPPPPTPFLLNVEIGDDAQRLLCLKPPVIIGLKSQDKPGFTDTCPCRSKSALFAFLNASPVSY